MIALVGAHGTGKTTLLREFCKKNSEFVWSDGTSRPMKQIAATLRLKRKEYQMANNIMAVNRYDMNRNQAKYMTTRTLLDNYVYSKLSGWDDLAEDVLREIEMRGMLEVDFFYLPIEFEIEDDGVRSPDKEFQRTYDREIRALMERLGLTYTKVVGTVGERVKLLEACLK